MVAVERLNRMMVFHKGAPTSESYIVNKYGAMITPSIYDKDSILKRVVKTEAFRQCQENGRFRGIYEGYIGKTVVGASKLVENSGWCVIVEIQEESAMAAISSLKYKTLFVFGISSVLIIFLSVFVSRLELRTINKMEDEFLNITSHELKTPITPIMGFLQRLLRNTKRFQIRKDVKEQLETCLRNSIRLNNLVTDILDITKLTSNRMKFNMKELKLEEVIENSIEDISTLIKGKNLKIVKKIEKLPVIIGDESRLMQVLDNLLNNAIKFTDKGTITLNAFFNKNCVQIDIKDTGVGIRKENIPKLFTKFFQTQEATTRKTKGTGLGLAISKEIIRAHNGRIWAESKGMGKGSTLSFTLPVMKRKYREL